MAEGAVKVVGGGEFLWWWKLETESVRVGTKVGFQDCGGEEKGEREREEDVGGELQVNGP